MLSNDPAGHLGPVQFGNLDMGKVPAHIRDAPLPNLPPPTVFPVSGFREDKKGEDPQEHGFTSSPAGNPRFQDIASRVDIPSPTCNRSKQQAQAQGQPQQQIGSDSYELKMSSKANFKELVQGSTGQMKASIVQKVPLSAAYDQCKGKSAGIGVESNLNVTVNGGLRGNSTECSSYKQQEPAVPSAMRALAPVSSQVREHCQEGHAALEIGHGADAATIEGGSSASCHSCSSSGAKPIPPPYSTVEECLVSTPSSSQLLEEQNSPYSGQAARWGPESGDVPSSAAAQPALGQLHACAPSSPQSSQASTGNMNPASTTGEQALEPTSSTCGPKVVVAIPSTLNAGASGKKMTWASIVSKPPKRVPYTTQAAGTIAPVTCCAESIVGSHLLAGKASPSIPGTRQQQPESPGTCERNLTSHLMTGRGGMRTSRESDLYSEAGSYKNGGVDKNSSGSRQDLDWSQTHVHSMPSGQAECGSGVSGPPASSAPKSDFNYRNSRQDFHSRDEHSHSRPSVTAGSRCSVPYGHCNASIPSRGGLHAKRVPCTLSQKGSPITENKSWGAQPARRSSTDSDRLKCFSTVRGLSSDGSPVTNVEVIPGAIDNQHIQCFPGDDLLGNALSAPSAGYICDRQQQGNMGVPLQATPKDVASTSTCLRSHEQCKTSFSSELHQEGQQSVFNSPVTSDRMADVLNTLCGTEPMEARRFYEQGIMNLGNTCFLGSAMQLLLGSELFCGLLHQLEAVRGQLHRGRLPTLCALGDLASKLSKRHEVNQPDGKSGLDHSVGMGRTPYAIVPTMLSPVLESFHRRFSGYQGGPEEQDAQEFLLFLLDQIESELQLVKLKFKGQEEEQPSCESDSEGWLVAGKNNRGSVRRTAGSTASNIVTSLFGGIIESQVRVKDRLVKDKSPSVTSHRFTALDLDIANKRVQTIDEALRLYTAKDSISDYRVEGCNRPVTAEKANLLSNLPPVLLVSLKRYTFTAGGMEKIQKKITFGRTLNIPAKYLVSGEQSAQYELIATCSHHGRGHGGDHYTANVMQPGGYWVHFDDSTHRAVKDKEVANDTPYLMLYRKINTKQLSYQ